MNTFGDNNTGAPKRGYSWFILLALANENIAKDFQIHVIQKKLMRVTNIILKQHG